MQLLADGIAVEPLDASEYVAKIEHFNAKFHEYGRVLISLGAEALPGADLSGARHVDKVPELVFGGYHPDQIYLTCDAQVVEGPIGPYNSLIAFLAHGQGRSASDTVALFNGRVYEACGYMNTWTAARDQLVRHCSDLGYDIELAVRSWGRRGAFMYSVNHPRIHVLSDIARIYLEREGFAPQVSDVLPHDNMINAAAFAVYPEIGENLGVPGVYLFKRPFQYTQIGLRQFVEESFAFYDTYPRGALETHRLWRVEAERVAAVLSGMAAA